MSASSTLLTELVSIVGPNRCGFCQPQARLRHLSGHRGEGVRFKASCARWEELVRLLCSSCAALMITEVTTSWAARFITRAPPLLDISVRYLCRPSCAMQHEGRVVTSPSLFLC